MRYVLGIDVSTTATKAVLFDAAGTVAAVGSTHYDFATPRPLWSEQDPGLWWDGAARSIEIALQTAGAGGPDVAAVGLTGQMHGLVLLDAAGEVLRPAILWNDQRTAGECDQIRTAVGRERLISITGNDALTGFTAPKILWVRNHEPDVFARVATVLLPKDYVRVKLTGERATDRAGASGTILFDLAARDWSPSLLDLLDLDRDLFPPTFEGPAVTGTVTRAAAAATGLRAGTPVVAGGGDQAANGVGLGVVDPGTLALSLGTSGVVFAATDRPRIDSDGRLHAFCHAVPERWHLMGVMLSAAGSLRWFRDVAAAHLDYSQLDEAAVAVPAGSDGLFFLPYLSGERTPHPDPHARGAFVGLTVRHGTGHLVRAVMEGVAYGLRDGLELIKASGAGGVDEIRASGGGTRSRLWCQVLADTLGGVVRIPSTSEGAAQGAAMLAAIGAGWFDDARTAASTWVQLDTVATPGPDAARYEAGYGVYRELYPALRPFFPPLD